MIKTLNKKRVILFISIIFTMILSAIFVKSDMDSPQKDDVKFLIGMSQANLNEPWRVVMNEEIETQAEKYDNLKVIFKDAAQNSNRQIEDVKQLMKYGIDLLIISMNNSKDLSPIIEQVYNKIPVIVLDRAVEGYEYTLFIGPDNEAIGKETGRFIKELIGDKGNIVEIQGLKNSPPVKDRSEGVRKIIGENKNIKIVETIDGEWRADKSEDEFKKIIEKNPKIDLVFAQSDAMAYGAYKAAKEMNVKDIKFLGVDGLSGLFGGINLVQTKALTGTFVCQTGGKEAIEYAVKILENKKPIPKKILLRSYKITPENVENYIKNEGITKTVKNKKMTLGFAQLGEESGWRIANTNSIKAAAMNDNVSLKLSFANGSQASQIENIQKLIDEKVDVIAFPPLVESGWEGILKKAKEANIPIILCDRKADIIDENLWTTYIGSDFIEEGKRAARWLVKEYKNKKNINIVELRGTDGSNPAIERKKGFEEIIKSHSNFNIIKSETAHFNKEHGKAVMKEILKNSIKIDVVYAHNDDMALGAVEAIEEAKLIPGKDIKIISIDGTKPALKALSIGKLNFVVECNPLLGPQIIEVAKDLGNKKDVPKVIITEEKVFTRESAKKELYGRGY